MNCVDTFPTQMYVYHVIITQQHIPYRDLRCCRLPKHLNWPLTMMASRLQSASHSSIEWVVRTTDWPRSTRRISESQRNRRAPGSMPVVCGWCKPSTLGNHVHSYRFVEEDDCRAADESDRRAQLALVTAAVRMISHLCNKCFV